MIFCAIGIDPGQAGGIAWKHGFHAFAVPMPKTERDIVEVLRVIKTEGPNTYAYLEKVSAMPKQGVASTFTFGKNYGVLRGILTALDIPFEDVLPRAWQSTYGMKKKKTESKTEWKNRLKQKAQQLHPNLPRVTLATADALLIAEHGFRRLAVLRSNSGT